jgi:Carboxypeptidase regulatory-like domain
VFSGTTCSRVSFRLIFGLVLLALLCGVAERTAMGQVLYGSVVGSVTDPTGAVIPGAPVTLTNRQTGLSKDATSDDGGRYSFVNVLPGQYDLKVTAKGFKTFHRNELQRPAG